jgi:Zn ribbon nucleic-acid-binding protein
MSQYVPCPKCATPDPQQVKFTWWGGVLGPKLLSHVKCVRCGNAYNGKSGQSNTQGIIIYSLAAVGIVFMVFFGLGILSFLAR